MCDTVTDGGGWTIFQRRVSGAVDFYRNWEEYKYGFGDFDAGEFYLGNENIYCLTSEKSYDLRIDMSFNGSSYFAQYSKFQLYPESQFYKISYDEYSGNAGDYLQTSDLRQMFSTYDKDNDIDDTRQCAVTFHGAWWYSRCHMANLNGLWGSKEYGVGVQWDGVTGDVDSLDFSEMKIRPK
ncbi:ficolin-2-like [Physella acuta]|uniref:ficolin-2-like n=1 Tax=Physella acuta TaxID=109671 RepID=UPI0027DBD200|nr:ficolin-2-like [Physella acuta]